ncbi:stage IV sporulation protein A [uncultured Eubacterium sp.]|uniref:stage IV sporulation protein A n=1 Tax=uncultured Eubacterium sp. TaxID=165185 RepID=UPI00267124E9|nr:stage IV sporulation protein A [uncultured Eubacterium sp.]
MDFNVYKDIEKRTNGEIYIGVVGPVRTGKSTFIKNFMDVAVVPNIADQNEVKRTMDELPQSSSGKTIMTTEPKFIPNNAVSIKIGGKANVKVRLIDCVGFMVDGATGHMEEDKERMVKTPWFDYDIPFSKAAEIGTQKVISEHSTIGVVITCDGSFTDLDPAEYNKALDKTVRELNSINKPFIILVNSLNPESEQCLKLREEIANKYNVSTLAINCLKLNEKDVNNILENILFEFPITEIVFNVPKWLEIMDFQHELMKYIVDYSKEILGKVIKIKDIKKLKLLPDKEYMNSAQMASVELSNGKLVLNYDIDDKYYYETLTEMTGTKIDNQLQLIKMVRELSMQKNNYIKVNEAISKVRSTGYGIVTPEKEEIVLEDPELIKTGSKYGVKIKATAPSIHFVKANILTEISPIIGSEEQAKDMINFINKKEEGKSIWDTNIFGKSIGQIVDEGITNKINNLTEETQSRMQGTIEKITNDQSRGVICILL